MRISSIFIIGALAVAVGTPALAQKKTAYGAPVQSFEACETQAVALGMPHGQVGHVEFVRECMGKRPGNSNRAASGN